MSLTMGCIYSFHNAKSKHILFHLIKKTRQYLHADSMEIVWCLPWEGLIMLFSLNTVNPAASFDLLSNYTGRPVGIPPPLDSPSRMGQITHFTSMYLSTSAAISAGFGAFGAFQATGQYQVWASDYGTFANQPDLDPSNGIDGWTYGAGYRIGIIMEKNMGQLKAGLPVFAAEVTLNSAKVFVQIITYGMPAAPPIPVTDLSNFDVNAYAKYIAWQNEVHGHIASSKDRLTPVLTHASFTSDFDRNLKRLLPVLYALRRIQDKHTLVQAIEIATRHKWELDLPALRIVYAKCTGNILYYEHGGSADPAVITDAASNYAASILNYYDKLE